MLNHVCIGPNGLVGELRQKLGVIAILCQSVSIGVCLDACIYPHVVVSCLPRRTVTLGATNLSEECLSTLYILIAQVTSCGNGQSTVPNHKLVILLVAHLLFAIIRCSLEKILVKGFLLGYRRTAQYLVDTIGNALVGAISVIRMENARFGSTMLLDVADNLLVFALCLCPSGSGIEEVTVRTSNVGDVPDGICTSTVLQ